jgi:flagellar hook-basal body protein
LIPKASALTIQSAPVTTLLGNVTGQTAVGTSGTAFISLESGNVSFSADAVTDASGNTSTITVTGATSDLVGKTLYVGTTDTRRTVTAVSGNTVTLSAALDSTAGTPALAAVVIGSTDTVTFKGIDLPSGLAAGDKIFMNGVDTGLTVGAALLSNIGTGNTANPKVHKIAVSGSNIDIPASASFTFFKADLTATASSTAGGRASITLNATASSELVGRRLFDNGVDTGLTVTSVNGTSVFLDGALSADATTVANKLTFKQTLDMTLLAPDGTKIVVQGTSNKQNSGTILNAVQSNLEVYASINGVFYDHSQAANTFSSKPGAPDVQTTGGYQTVAKIGLVAGRNIDSLLVDNASGKPVFSTSARLSTRVNAGSQQSTTIPLIYDLDLSDTQLQASSFVVNQSYQNGEPRSELSSVTIDGAGTIVGVYGNGRKIVAGQIALAQFDADEQLIPAGNNAFAPSYRSGTEGDNGVRIGRAGEGSFGEIKSMAVEASTVDLSNELVKLMILQRMYSANSQSIKAFDQTLRDTIQMTS